jgi:NAD(P)-dependent dehydrogenase (short-subunit alcohol dehydrogenase family)
MKTLAGRKVLLTGGLGSLGRAQAVTLARAGARVLLLDRPDATNAVEIVAGLAGEASGDIAFIGCDLNRLAEAEAAVAALAAKEGGIDILINNAALIINRPFEEFSLTEYEEQIRVNSSAAFALGRLRALCRLEGRHAWPHQVAGARAWAAWHQGQRRLAGRGGLGGGRARLRRPAERIQ